MSALHKECDTSVTGRRALRYDDWLDQIAEAVDLSVTEEAMCRRWFKFGTQPAAAIDALRSIRNMMEVEEERQDQYVDYLDDMMTLERLMYFRQQRGG